MNRAYSQDQFKANNPFEAQGSQRHIQIQDNQEPHEEHQLTPFNEKASSNQSQIGNHRNKAEKQQTEFDKKREDAAKERARLQEKFNNSFVPSGHSNPRLYVQLNERPTKTDNKELEKMLKQVTFVDNSDDVLKNDFHAGTRDSSKYHTLLG